MKYIYLRRKHSQLNEIVAGLITLFYYYLVALVYFWFRQPLIGL